MVEVELEYRNGTAGGGEWFNNGGQKDICLPSSKIEIHTKSGRNPMQGEVVTVVMPEWLATEKGLV